MVKITDHLCLFTSEGIRYQACELLSVSSVQREFSSILHLLKTDQRGKLRPDKEDIGGCDMGAYERQKD